ncbi:type II secretion system protein G precursor [bacterium BMS3Abin07]|nr:type II secretion system protein G precursor [bacterium BMS3Abin07]GBE31663.1 type II secretion system protein G precursor [bacterium BMS3Bbin05]
MMGRIKNGKGFTLIELLIVLAIIGLLAGLVMPKMFKQEKKAKVRTAMAQIELFGGALDQFRLDTGSYPTTSEGLAALQTNPGIDGWDGPYLKKAIPADPWGQPYVYRNPGTHGDYDLLSYGPDKSEGGGDDIKSWE